VRRRSGDAGLSGRWHFRTRNTSRNTRAGRGQRGQERGEGGGGTRLTRGKDLTSRIFGISFIAPLVTSLKGVTGMLSSPPITLGAVARRFSVPTWKVRRLFERNLLPPAARVGCYRVIAATDLPEVEAALRRAGYLPEGEGVAS
jgi:hypothetical protein